MSSREPDDRCMKHDVGEVRKRKHVAIYPPAKRDMSLKRTGAREHAGPQNLTPARNVEGLLIASTDDDEDYMIQSNTPPLHAVPGSSTSGFGVGLVVNPEKCGYDIDMTNLVLQQQQNLPVPSTSQQANHGKLDKGKSIVKNGYYGLDRSCGRSSVSFTPVSAGTGNGERSQNASCDKSFGSPDLFADKSLFDDECSSPVHSVETAKLPVAKNWNSLNNASTSGGSSANTAHLSATCLSSKSKHLDLLSKGGSNASIDMNSARRGQNMKNMHSNDTLGKQISKHNHPNRLSSKSTPQFSEPGENSDYDGSLLFKRPDQIFKPRRLSVEGEMGFLTTPGGIDLRQRHDNDDSSDGSEEILFGANNEEGNFLSGAIRIPRGLDSPTLHSSGHSSSAAVRKHTAADVNKMSTNGSGDTSVACNNGTKTLNGTADGYNNRNNVLPYRHGDYMPSSLSDRELEPADSSEFPNLRCIGNSRMSLRQRIKPPDRFRSDDYTRQSGIASGSRSRWQDIALTQQAQQQQQLYSVRNPLRDTAIRGDRPSDTQSVMMEIHDDVSPVPVESPADDTGFRRSESFRRAVGPPRLPKHANSPISGGKSAANASGAGFVVTSARSSGGIGIGSANVGTNREADLPATITGFSSRYNSGANTTAVIAVPTADNSGEVIDIFETRTNTDRRLRHNRHRHLLNTRFDSSAPIPSTSGRAQMRQDSTTASDDDLPPSRRGNVRGSRRREIKPAMSHAERISRLDRADESSSGANNGVLGVAVDSSSNIYEQVSNLRAPPPPLRTTSISNRRSSSATTTTTNSVSPSPDYNRGVVVSSSEEPEVGEYWRSNLRRAARERRSARNYPLPPAAVMDESDVSIPASPGPELPSVARRSTAGRRQMSSELNGSRSSTLRPSQEPVAYTSSESSDSSNSTSNDSSIDTSLELTDSDDGEQEQGNDNSQQHSVEEIADVELNGTVDLEEGAPGGEGMRGTGNRMRVTEPPIRVPSNVAAGNRRALPRPPSTLAAELPAQLIDLASRSISDSSLLDEVAGIDDSSWQPAAAPTTTRTAPAGRRGATARANRPSAAARSSRRSQSAHAPSVATGDEDSDMDVEVLDENISNRTLQRIRQYEDDEAMARRLQAEFDAELARVAGAAGLAAPSIAATAPPEVAGTSSSHRRSTAVRARSTSPTPSSEASASPAGTARNVPEPEGSRRPLAVFTGAGSRRRVPLLGTLLPSTSAGLESHRRPTGGSTDDGDNDDVDDEDGFGFNLSIQEILSAVADNNFAEQAGGSSFPTARERTRGAARGANRARNAAGAESGDLQDNTWEILANYREREARTASTAAPSTSAAPARGTSAGETGPTARIRERRELISDLLAGVNRRGGESSTSSSSDNVPEAISPRPGPSRGNEPINIQNRGARYRLAASGFTARRTAGGAAGRRAANPHRILLENGSGVSIEIAGSGLHHLMQNRNPNATMDYDQMLRLTEALGDAVNPSLRKHEIDRIPVIKFTQSMFQSASLQVASTSAGAGADDATADCRHSCQICMCEYEVGELLRLLPCFHRYHSGCIDEWFGRKANCPICRVDVRQHLRDNQHDSADDDDL